MKGQEKSSTLKHRIEAEMTVDSTSALEKNFDLAKQFIRITKDGKVDILVKDRLSGMEQISLYLIGKLYAKEAGFIATDDVSNVELMTELGIPNGSLLPWQMTLRKDKKINRVKQGKFSNHVAAINMVEKILKSVEAKLRPVSRGFFNEK